MKVAAIIPVAGSGKRFAGTQPKQFTEISGRPVIAITLTTIISVGEIGRIMVVCAADAVEQITAITGTISGFSRKGSITRGGKERQDSVYNGLKQLDEDTEIVLVHDGVRPFVSPEILVNSIGVAQRDGACVAAVRAKDTIKRVRENRVLETLERDELWHVQTPQTARYAWLMAAHAAARRAGYYTTDEAALLEWQGYPVQVIDGDDINIKITTPEDMKLARLIYEESLN